MSFSEKQPESSPISFGGSCACNRMTYSCHSTPSNSLMCHCVSCRKLSGAAYQCFLEILDTKAVTFYDNNEHLRYEGLPKDNIGGIVFLRLSKFGERAYCVDCYTPLAMRYKRQEGVVYLTLGSVDEGTIGDGTVKAALEPKRRIFMAQNAWWCTAGEGLPSVQRFGGDFEEEIKGDEGKEG